jgi:hypothetical protein
LRSIDRDRRGEAFGGEPPRDGAGFASDRLTGSVPPSIALKFPARFSRIQFQRLESGMPSRFAAAVIPSDFPNVPLKLELVGILSIPNQLSLAHFDLPVHKESYQLFDVRQTRARSRYYSFRHKSTCILFVPTCLVSEKKLAENQALH